MIKNRLKNKLKNKGFTLIELLMVIALTALSVGITSDILMTLTRGYNKTQVLNEIEQQSNFVSLKLQKELKNAVLVSAPVTTTENVNANQITLRNRNDEYITYYFKSTQDDGRTIGRLYRHIGTDPVPGSVSGVALTDSGLNNIGGVNVICTGPTTSGADCPAIPTSDCTCFTVSSNNPKVVNYNIQFNQSQKDAKKDYEGSVSLKDVVVIRNTYSVTRQAN